MTTTRRDFLGLAAGAAVLGVAGCGDGGGTCAQGPDGKLACALPQPTEAPFDTVVVLMMENRSFDHLLGWLPGANGRQAGLTYLDRYCQPHATWHVAPDYQGCRYADPGHDWQAMAMQYNEGRCDGFLRISDDTFPVSYYTEADLPILSVLARNYTTFDNYFCSMLGATWDNRLYQLTGTTQLDMPDGFPKTDAQRPCTIQTAIFDRVLAAGLRTAYYYFGEPMTGLFKSKKYDAISLPVDRFFEDARRGTLPNVCFVDPDYTDDAEDRGTSNDYHWRGSVLVAEEFVAKVYNALKDSPQWGRLVFVLNFDESGGFYDHVPPPACQDDTVLTPPLLPDDELLLPVCLDPAHFIDKPPAMPDLKRLGFRVPAIAMGPFAPRKIESAGPYEHCSVLRMIEWRWNLEPLTLRSRTAKNLADALDFKKGRDPVTLPPFAAPAPVVCG